MAKITVYGGTEKDVDKGEVGGNKILVEADNGSGIMLDFGTRMGYEGEFFAEFLSPKTKSKMRDKLLIGALPVLDNTYDEKQLKFEDDEGILTSVRSLFGRVIDMDSELFELPFDLNTYDENVKPRFHSVLISHAHLDHVGDIKYLHTDISVYCTETTKTIMETIDNVTTSQFSIGALNTKVNRVSQSGPTSTFPNSPRVKSEDETERPCHTVSDLKEFELDGFRVKPIFVDHSLHGACSYLLTLPEENKTILYTGDLRFSGVHNRTIDEYVNKIGSDVDIMICEGTRIDSRNPIFETDVERMITDDIRRTDGVVFIDFGWKDITRYETILKAARKTGRTFIISGKLAYLLKRLGTDLPDDVKVFLKRKESLTYSPSDYSKARHEISDDLEWGRRGDPTLIDRMVYYHDGITAGDIAKDPGRYVMMFSFYDLKELFDMVSLDQNKGGYCIPNSRFIKAVCSPFNDDMELDEERLINWLDTFGIDYDIGDPRIPDNCQTPNCEKIRPRIRRAHVSGHASGKELEELITKIAPKVLIPIHTPEPKLFRDMISNINSTLSTPIDLMMPELNKEIRV